MLVGDFVNFKCNEGYHISGTSTIGCRTNGTWSGPKPTCLIDNCEMLLPSVLHSVLIERTYETLENLTGVLTVSCNIGFERIGNEKMFCRDAIWTYTDNKQPACHRNSSVSIRDEITMRNLEHATVLVREGDEMDLSCTIDGSSSTTTFEKLGGGNNGTNLWIQNFTMEDVENMLVKPKRATLYRSLMLRFFEDAATSATWRMVTYYIMRTLLTEYITGILLISNATTVTSCLEVIHVTAIGTMVA
ncbi:hypothetical protein BSL78_21394 [Apostichopus japonicus]|uniref:Sushi domain-containing protein n=1 Tax=Stichopus japonicus TaxID=307972 RepID=A0A2G8K197_STIJA|nr:hypothetical protein BSL78_21394 [Apostichopus japonicus]